MSIVKKFFKRNTHNVLLGSLAAFGRSVNRLYENRNHDIFSNGEYWLVKRISALQPKVIFDVGANTGKYCQVLMQHCPQATIYCFEPVTKTFDILKSAVNHKRVHLVKKGLYRENKSLTINLYPSHTHASLFELKAVPYESVGTEKIELISGDDFIDQNRINSVDLVKLDIEGAELDALKGLKNSFVQKK